MATTGHKVLVAMSGGVDSSVAAAMLVRAGHEVIGCFMRLGSPDEVEGMVRADDCAVPAGGDAKRAGHKGCCSVGDAADARAVAAELGVPLYVCNFRRDFGRVIDYFVEEYAAGRTPNPCIRCNDWLKFGKLHEYARQLGCGFVASGHYARIGAEETERPAAAGELRDGEAKSGARLLRAVDHAKDQSYVLFGVPRAQLGSMMLPIGEFHKPRVREMAERFGLPVFNKPDSQEICFVPDDDYAGLVERRRPDLVSSGGGRVLDPEGREVGRHDGHHRFTIGQRRGVGLALGYPVYVVDKDPATNTVTVGPRERLDARGCVARDANWLTEAGLAGTGEWTRVFAKHRSNSPAVAAEARVLGEVGASSKGAAGACAGFEVRFDTPQFAVAPGQAVVLYDAEEPDVVLGGGWISAAT
ncbi:MAG: tRNA 2-thiouridine(34) synthase MnmA [Phycisphaerales bacterium]